MAQDGIATDSLSAALEREHREIDEGIQAFAGGPGGHDPQGLVDAIRVLRRHIYAEEELLFPPLRDAGLVGPILVMLREHAQMWQLLDLLDEQLASDHAAARGTCGQLFDLLARHNPKEETILYPQADTVLTPSRASQVRAFLTAEEPPEGWVCQGLRH